MIRTWALAVAVVLLSLCGAIIMFSQPTTKLPEGMSLPAFSLPRLADPAPALTAADLTQGIVMVNFFSSWCGPCRVEHPFLMELKTSVPIIGINYMDSRENAQAFLQTLGNPYTDIAIDAKGQMALTLGVDSVPRTLLIVKGRIVYGHNGKLSREEINKNILPLFASYKRRA